jgi:uncharacterized damage-inducible protein DinB
MKAYFIQLFDYDRFANLRILETIKKASDADKPLQLLAHLLAAQQIWLNRCEKEPATGVATWPDWSVNIFESMINNHHQKWIKFLEGPDNEGFEQLISYKNTRGESFESKLSDILAHVINHSAHHRAQAGLHLKLTGIELPNTDYISYVRGHK